MRHWMDDPELGRACLPFSPLRFGGALALQPIPCLKVPEGIVGFSTEGRAALREAQAIRAAGLVRRYKLNI